MPTTLHTCDIARCTTARWHHCDTCRVVLTAIGYIGDGGEALCGDCEKTQHEAHRETYDEDAAQDAVAGRPHWGTS